METTEQQLIEMAKHMKEIVDAKDIELRKYKIKYIESKKLICKFYGLIRVIQQEFDSNYDLAYDECPLDWTITELRSNISDYLFGEEERDMDIYGY